MVRIYIAVGYKINPVKYIFDDNELINFIECATEKKPSSVTEALDIFNNDLAKKVIVFTPREAKDHVEKNGEYASLLLSG